MRTVFLSFIFIVVAVIANAQIVIRGKVVDSADMTIANASIYLNHTSIGSSSNNAGEFIIEANGIYSGELIVSAAGYECLSYKLEIASTANKLYKFKLVKKKVIKNVLIQPSLTRQLWLDRFKTSLLGITEEADYCSIKNLESVYFVLEEDQNLVYAYADSPLIIINKLLGYEITYDLVEFSDKNKGSYFLGYSRYREMGDKRKWAKRRQQNYYGSTMHFFRSLISKNLYEQGYSLFEIKKTRYPLNTGQHFNLAVIDPAGVAPIEAVKILFIDDSTNEYYLKFDNRMIVVQYKKTPHSVAYLSTKGFVQGLNDKGYTAYISLMTDKLGIDINGAVEEPLLISYSGFWVYEKLANQLPYNYQPQ